uniref:UTRA domain-containing protein n=1 Tax=Phenylobacterium glaciei TaxID=2803784 RepID=A0A974S963_9CAUL|nr:UTRA domain-containing protein [Phenylobacterium glaciei]
MALWRAISQSLERRILARELTPATSSRRSSNSLGSSWSIATPSAERSPTCRKRGSSNPPRAGAAMCGGPRPHAAPAAPRFSEHVRERGRIPRTETLKLTARAADAKVAAQLGLRLGQPIIYLERRRFIDDEPTGISQHHFSHDRFPTFIEMYRARGSITQTLIDSGIPDYTRRRTAISARLPTADEAEQLHIPRHVPLLVHRYLNIDGLGRPLEYGISARRPRW